MKGIGQLTPTQVRIPLELRDWLKHRAVDNRRSFNSEVLDRLERSRKQEEVQPPKGNP